LAYIGITKDELDNIYINLNLYKYSKNLQKKEEKRKNCRIYILIYLINK